MSFTLEFLPEASAELECVTGQYEARVPGLGVRFRQVVESACAAIVQHPLLWPERRGGYRRVNLPGFPYYIAFILRNDIILITAVAHASRHPEYCKAGRHESPSARWAGSAGEREFLLRASTLKMNLSMG